MSRAFSSSWQPRRCQPPLGHRGGAARRDRAGRRCTCCSTTSPAPRSSPGSPSSVGPTTSPRSRTDWTPPPPHHARHLLGLPRRFEFTAERRHPFRPPPEHGPFRASGRSGDPLGWHELHDPPEIAMRRARRIDVWERRGPPGSTPCSATAAGPEGSEGACTSTRSRRGRSRDGDAASVTAVLCAALRRVPGCGAECVVDGRNRLRAMRREVLTARDTDCCTHLNDGLRSLAEVPVLADLLPANRAIGVGGTTRGTMTGATKGGRPRRFEAEDELRILLDAAFTVMQQNGYTDATVANILRRGGSVDPILLPPLRIEGSALCALYRREADAAAACLKAKVDAARNPGRAPRLDRRHPQLRPRRNKAARVAVLGSPGAMRGRGVRGGGGHAARQLTRRGGPAGRGAADGSFPPLTRPPTRHWCSRWPGRRRG